MTRKHIPSTTTPISHEICWSSRSKLATRRGIRVPVYTTIQWDRQIAAEHPEWLVVGADGIIHTNPPDEAGFYARLCVNTAYRDFLKAHVRDIFECVPAVDGFFFDIVNTIPCVCQHCRAQMLAQGLDPGDPEARQAFSVRTLEDFTADLTAFTHGLDPDCTVFYNSGHIGTRHRSLTGAFTHWEVESLPSGGWGYLHLPISLRYARTLGLDALSMSAKFHTFWGDFHSFKNRAALEFECFRALALGAKCSIGDQLHPVGRLCPATYDLIGSVYDHVEEKEPWCRGARPVTDMAVFSPEECNGEMVSPPASGAVRMLQEGFHQFDLVDSRSDLSAYKVVILPDVISVSPELADILTSYLAKGGALIASHQSGPESRSRLLRPRCARRDGQGRRTLQSRFPPPR